MGSDNRDWYRDWWRKRTGYTERAAFRIGDADHKRAKVERRRAAHSSAWKRNVFIAAAVLAVIVGMALFR